MPDAAKASGANLTSSSSPALSGSASGGNNGTIRADTALTALHRLLGAGDRHPLVILAVLHRHVQPVVTLDGAGVTSEGAAAAALGIEPGRSTFPAKKALATLRHWGSDGAARALQLVADADLDLRGDSTWPPDAVLEVLVGRLCRIAPRSAGSRPSTGSRRR